MTTENEKCKHIQTRTKLNQTGSWCVRCGEKVYEVETRGCNGCVHFKKLFDGSICQKLLMGVTETMKVTYKIETGTCFELKPTEQPKVKKSLKTFVEEAIATRKHHVQISKDLGDNDKVRHYEGELQALEIVLSEIVDTETEQPKSAEEETRLIAHINSLNKSSKEIADCLYKTIEELRVTKLERDYFSDGLNKAIETIKSLKGMTIQEAEKKIYPDGGGKYLIDGKWMKVHCDEYHMHSFKCLSICQNDDKESSAQQRIKELEEQLEAADKTIEIFSNSKVVSMHSDIEEIRKMLKAIMSYQSLKKR